MSQNELEKVNRNLRVDNAKLRADIVKGEIKIGELIKKCEDIKSEIEPLKKNNAFLLKERKKLEEKINDLESEPLVEYKTLQQGADGPEEVMISFKAKNK